MKVEDEHMCSSMRLPLGKFKVYPLRTCFDKTRTKLAKHSNAAPLDAHKSPLRRETYQLIHSPAGNSHADLSAVSIGF